LPMHTRACVATPRHHPVRQGGATACPRGLRGGVYDRLKNKSEQAVVVVCRSTRHHGCTPPHGQRAFSASFLHAIRPRVSATAHCLSKRPHNPPCHLRPVARSAGYPDDKFYRLARHTHAGSGLRLPRGRLWPEPTESGVGPASSLKKRCLLACEADRTGPHVCTRGTAIKLQSTVCATRFQLN
jgi:hypothetical protein